MEIIKRGDWQPPTFTAELVCYNCHSILKIDADDILSVYDDWDDYKYAINPRANWRNCISKTNLEWIMWEDENTIWIRNRSSYPSLFKYTGWSIWKDGKCEFGKLAISK